MLNRTQAIRLGTNLVDLVMQDFAADFLAGRTDLTRVIYSALQAPYFAIKKAGAEFPEFAEECGVHKVQALEELPQTLRAFQAQEDKYRTVFVFKNGTGASFEIDWAANSVRVVRELVEGREVVVNVLDRETSLPRASAVLSLSKERKTLMTNASPFLDEILGLVEAA